MNFAVMNVAANPECVKVSIAGGPDRGKVREAVAHHAAMKFGDLLIVAGGIGDAAEGGQASQLAVDIISSRLESMLAFFPPEIAVEEAVRQANTELMAASAVPESPCSCMGVKLIVGLLRTGADRASVTIGQVGDGRAYLVRKRKLSLLNVEPTGVEPTAAQAMLEGKWTTPHDEEPHSGHSHRSTSTPYLGQGLNIKVAMSEIELEGGDTLLLCSDGLWRSLSEQEIERVLANQNQSAEEACRALLDLTRDAGGNDNVAIEIARLTQNGDSPGTSARAVQNPALPTTVVGERAAEGAAAIEWRTPESITYGTALDDTQLNATASAPGTFLYNPGPGAMLSTGEHTLSVVFMPSNQSDCTPVQASVPLRVAKATPSISWPAPEAISQATPLGPAQLNAQASVPGSFDYSPATGEMPGIGTHALSVTFTPADRVNYTPVEASVSLTVIEPMPATITWLSPASIAYGTVLGDQQLNAKSPVRGTFLYVPAPGNVLPPGKHELLAIFTPEDQVRYTGTQAAVTLIVEELPMLAPLSKAASPGAAAELAAEETVAELTGEPSELPGSFANTKEAATPQEAGGAANEVDRSTRLQDDAGEAAIEPGTREALEAEVPLFRGFQSFAEVEGGQKRTSKWLTIASVVLAIPMLCVLAFLIDKAHSGAPFLAKQTNQPASATGDTHPQSNTQDPADRVKLTVDQASARPGGQGPAGAGGQAPAGTAGQPASNSQPGSSAQSASPAPVQTEAIHDQAAVPSETPQGSRKQAAENVPSAANFGTSNVGGAGRSESGPNEGKRPAATEETSSAREGATGPGASGPGAVRPVAVSAEAAAERLMESRTAIYPPAAKAQGISGTVELEATIAKDGTVKDLRVVSGPAELRQAAIQSVRAWRYRPFIVNNEPAEVETTINVFFRSTTDERAMVAE